MEEIGDTGKDLFNIKREVDSMDDFEHLGHDSSPLQDLLGLKLDKEVTAPETVHEIDITPKTAVSHHTGSSDFVPNPVIPEKMNRNLLEDDFLGRGEGSEKLDNFLQNPTLNPTPAFDIGHNKKSSFNLIEAERGTEPQKNIMDQFLDIEDHQEQIQFKDGSKSNAFGDVFKPEPVPPKPLIPEISSELPHVSIAESLPEKVSSSVPEKVSPIVHEQKSALADVIKPEHMPEKKPEVLREKTPEMLSEKRADLLPEKKPEPERTTKITTNPAKIVPPDAAALFCKMGLDAWFNPEKLDPKVESLIYWRDPKKSGPVFGGVLVVLLALTYFSLISVIAYLSLIGLTVTVAFRIYKNIVQAVQKTGDGHPFKDFLDLDVSLPQDKVKEITEIAVAHINAAVVELRRLFLVEDLVDSIKFGVLLWTLTYVGAWFNGMTLIILAWVALFTLPKVYEANKTQIDANLEIVRTKLAEITSKIKAAIPMGKKPEEKKEQ